LQITFGGLEIMQSDSTKLLFLGCKDFPPFANEKIISGGMEVYTYELTKRLASTMDIRLIVGQNGSTKDVYDEELNCTVNKVPIYGQSVLQPISLMISSFFKAWKTRKDITIINAQTPLSALVAVACKFFFRKPYILSVHSFGSTTEHVGNRLYAMIYYLIERITLKYADKVVTAGESLKKFLSERHKIPFGAISVIHSGMDIAEVKRDDDFLKTRFNIKPDDFVLFFLGRYINENGVFDIIEAVRLLNERGVKVKLYFAGSGDLKQEISSRAKEYKIEDEVIELGPIYGEEKYQLIERADLLVRTSYHEVFPVAYLEALSVGTPVLATPVGDSAFIAKDSGGVELVPVHAPRAAADAIERLKSDPKRLKKMAESGINYIKTIPWNVQAEKLLEITKEVLDTTI
jgi:glycosyltransferase involved in cell wall biosynthesis